MPEYISDERLQWRNGKDDPVPPHQEKNRHPRIDGRFLNVWNHQDGCHSSQESVERIPSAFEEYRPFAPVGEYPERDLYVEQHGYGSLDII